MDFQALSRKELQALCKKNRIPANITTVAMVQALQSLQMAEGIAETQELPQFRSPVLPHADRRTTVRRSPIREEPKEEQASPLPQARRVAAKTPEIIIIEDDDEEEIKEVHEARPKTPVMFAARKTRALGKPSKEKEVGENQEVEMPKITRKRAGKIEGGEGEVPAAIPSLGKPSKEKEVGENQEVEMPKITRKRAGKIEGGEGEVPAAIPSLGKPNKEKEVGDNQEVEMPRITRKRAGKIEGGEGEVPAAIPSLGKPSKEKEVGENQEVEMPKITRKRAGKIEGGEGEVPAAIPSLGKPSKEKEVGENQEVEMPRITRLRAGKIEGGEGEVPAAIQSLGKPSKEKEVGENQEVEMPKITRKRAGKIKGGEGEVPAAIMSLCKPSKEKEVCENQEVEMPKITRKRAGKIEGGEGEVPAAIPSTPASTIGCRSSVRCVAQTTVAKEKEEKKGLENRKASRRTRQPARKVAEASEKVGRKSTREKKVVKMGVLDQEKEEQEGQDIATVMCNDVSVDEEKEGEDIAIVKSNDASVDEEKEVGENQEVEMPKITRKRAGKIKGGEGEVPAAILSQEVEMPKITRKRAGKIEGGVGEAPAAIPSTPASTIGCRSSVRCVAQTTVAKEKEEKGLENRKASRRTRQPARKVAEASKKVGRKSTREKKVVKMGVMDQEKEEQEEVMGSVVLVDVEITDPLEQQENEEHEGKDIATVMSNNVLVDEEMKDPLDQENEEQLGEVMGSVVSVDVEITDPLEQQENEEHEGKDIATVMSNNVLVDEEMKDPLDQENEEQLGEDIATVMCNDVSVDEEIRDPLDQENEEQGGKDIAPVTSNVVSVNKEIGNPLEQEGEVMCNEVSVDEENEEQEEMSNDVSVDEENEEQEEMCNVVLADEEIMDPLDRENEEQGGKVMCNEVSVDEIGDPLDSNNGSGEPPMEVMNPFDQIGTIVSEESDAGFSPTIDDEAQEDMKSEPGDAYIYSLDQLAAEGSNESEPVQEFEDGGDQEEAVEVHEQSDPIPVSSESPIRGLMLEHNQELNPSAEFTDEGYDGTPIENQQPCVDITTEEIGDPSEQENEEQEGKVMCNEVSVDEIRLEPTMETMNPSDHIGTIVSETKVEDPDYVPVSGAVSESETDDTTEAKVEDPDYLPVSDAVSQSETDDTTEAKVEDPDYLPVSDAVSQSETDFTTDAKVEDPDYIPVSGAVSESETDVSGDRIEKKEDTKLDPLEQENEEQKVKAVMCNEVSVDEIRLEASMETMNPSNHIGTIISEAKVEDPDYFPVSGAVSESMETMNPSNHIGTIISEAKVEDPDYFPVSGAVSESATDDTTEAKVEDPDYLPVSGAVSQSETDFTTEAKVEDPDYIPVSGAVSQSETDFTTEAKVEDPDYIPVSGAVSESETDISGDCIEKKEDTKLVPLEQENEEQEGKAVMYEEVSVDEIRLETSMEMMNPFSQIGTIISESKVEDPHYIPVSSAVRESETDDSGDHIEKDEDTKLYLLPSSEEAIDDLSPYHAQKIETNNSGDDVTSIDAVEALSGKKESDGKAMLISLQTLPESDIICEADSSPSWKADSLSNPSHVTELSKLDLLLTDQVFEKLSIDEGPRDLIYEMIAEAESGGLIDDNQTQPESESILESPDESMEISEVCEDLTVEKFSIDGDSCELPAYDEKLAEIKESDGDGLFNIQMQPKSDSILDSASSPLLQVNLPDENMQISEVGEDLSNQKFTINEDSCDLTVEKFSIDGDSCELPAYDEKLAEIKESDGDGLFNIQMQRKSESILDSASSPLLQVNLPDENMQISEVVEDLSTQKFTINEDSCDLIYGEMPAETEESDGDGLINIQSILDFSSLLLQEVNSPNENMQTSDVCENLTVEKFTMDEEDSSDLTYGEMSSESEESDGEGLINIQTQPESESILDSASSTFLQVSSTDESSCDEMLAESEESDGEGLINIQTQLESQSILDTASSTLLQVSSTDENMQISDLGEDLTVMIDSCDVTYDLMLAEIEESDGDGLTNIQTQPVSESIIDSASPPLLSDACKTPAQIVDLSSENQLETIGSMQISDAGESLINIQTQLESESIIVSALPPLLSDACKTPAQIVDLSSENQLETTRSTEISDAGESLINIQTQPKSESIIDSASPPLLSDASESLDKFLAQLELMESSSISIQTPPPESQAVVNSTSSPLLEALQISDVIQTPAKSFELVIGNPSTPWPVYKTSGSEKLGSAAIRSVGRMMGSAGGIYRERSDGREDDDKENSALTVGGGAKVRARVTNQIQRPLDLNGLSLRQLKAIYKNKKEVTRTNMGDNDKVEGKRTALTAINENQHRLQL